MSGARCTGASASRWIAAPAMTRAIPPGPVRAPDMGPGAAALAEKVIPELGRL